MFVGIDVGVSVVSWMCGGSETTITGDGQTPITGAPQTTITEEDQTKIKTKIRIGCIPLNVMTPPYAEYIGAWTDEGLDVELQQFKGGPALVEALAAGSLDAADIGYVPMIYAATNNLPLFYLASDGIASKDYPMFSLTVPLDSTWDLALID